MVLPEKPQKGWKPQLRIYLHFSLNISSIILWTMPLIFCSRVYNALPARKFQALIYSLTRHCWFYVWAHGAQSNFASSGELMALRTPVLSQSLAITSENSQLHFQTKNQVKLTAYSQSMESRGGYSSTRSRSAPWIAWYLVWNLCWTWWSLWVPCIPTWDTLWSEQRKHLLPWLSHRYRKHEATMAHLRRSISLPFLTFLSLPSSSLPSA